MYVYFGFCFIYGMVIIKVFEEVEYDIYFLGDIMLCLFF